MSREECELASQAMRSLHTSVRVEGQGGIRPKADSLDLFAFANIYLTTERAKHKRYFSDVVRRKRSHHRYGPLLEGLELERL